jgi:nucleoside 2-deoxyribosyltransferase
VAYAYALGKPVFAYSNAAENRRDRVSSALGLKPPVAGQENREFASDGMEVENFNLADNLMIVEAIRRQGRDIVTPAASVADPLGDLAAFEECLRRARIYFIELKSSAAA